MQNFHVRCDQTRGRPFGLNALMSCAMTVKVRFRKFFVTAGANPSSLNEGGLRRARQVSSSFVWAVPASLKFAASVGGAGSTNSRVQLD